MFKILMFIIIVLIIIALIWIFINKKLIKQIIHFLWANYAVKYGKYEESNIDYDDLIEKQGDYDPNKLPTFIFGKKENDNEKDYMDFYHDDLFDNLEDDNEKYEKKHKSVFEILDEFSEENPEIVSKIAEENKKKEEEKQKEDKKYNYPIKRSEAIELSNKHNTLKTDFISNSNRDGVSFISFNDYEIKIITKDKKKYWQYQVLSGDISWIKHSDYETEYCDGYLTENDLKYLRCLIDCESGDYIYYPDVKKYNERIVKYEDAINNIIKINKEPPEWMKRLNEELENDEKNLEREVEDDSKKARPRKIKKDKK